VKIIFGNITPFILLTIILFIVYLFNKIEFFGVFFPIIFYFIYNVIWIVIQLIKYR
jgi:hypothetical protein